MAGADSAVLVGRSSLAALVLSIYFCVISALGVSVCVRTLERTPHSASFVARVAFFFGGCFLTENPRSRKESDLPVAQIRYTHCPSGVVRAHVCVCLSVVAAEVRSAVA